MTNSENLLKELHALLKKYGAEITTEDHWTGYPECGQDVRMTITHEDWLVDLGTWVGAEGHGGGS